MGAVYPESRTGLPIAPFGFGFEHPWRVNSWDRFVLPRPFAPASCVGGNLIWAPPDADSSTLKQNRAQLQAELDRVQAAAEIMFQNRP